MKYKFALHSIAAVTLALLFCLPSNAQRQTPGRPSIELYATGGASPVGPFGPTGGGATWNMHHHLGHLTAGLDVLIAPVRYVEEAIFADDGTMLAPENVNEFFSYDVRAGGGYMVRLLSTRSRSVIFSAGGLAYIGVRYCPDLSQFTISSGSKAGQKVGQVGFLMDLVPEAQLEVFVSNNMSLYGSFRPRIEIVNTLAGKGDWIRMYAGLGVKYYL